MERSTVSRNLSLLMKHGWVEAVSVNVKGVREVVLTASGRNKIETVMPAWRRAQQEAAELLGAGGVTAVRSSRPASVCRPATRKSLRSAAVDAQMLYIHQIEEP